MVLNPPMEAGRANYPVSNLFHSCPQAQNHLSSLPGDQRRGAGGFADLRGRGLFLGQARDPKQLMIWSRHSRESIRTAHMEI
jgi:hypothetical protein